MDRLSSQVSFLFQWLNGQIPKSNTGGAGPDPSALGGPIPGQLKVDTKKSGSKPPGGGKRELPIEEGGDDEPEDEDYKRRVRMRLMRRGIVL